MHLYLPSIHNLAGVAGLGVTLLLFVLLGTVGCGRRALPETRLVAGWGLTCLVLTVWAVATSADLRLPLAALALLGGAILLRAGGKVGWERFQAKCGAVRRGKRDEIKNPGPIPNQTDSELALERFQAKCGAVRRGKRDEIKDPEPVPNQTDSELALGGAGRMLLLTIPLWLVMAPLRPSQFDTWANLLPNAAYLFDFGMLPAEGRPPSYSFLPAAPYNTQFAAFIASVVSGSFAEGVMGLFNIALQCGAALLLARVIENGAEAETEAGRRVQAPSWWACAAGFLLAVPLNPGFVPRVSFASYGEAPLAVTALFSVWLGALVIQRLARGETRPKEAVSLALALAALVNTKQSGIGLFLPIGVTMGALVLAHPRIPNRRGLGVTLAALVPALALYLLWRYFALHGPADAELKPLAFADWNFHLLPQILASVAQAMYEKATYTVAVLAVLGFAASNLRRDPWSERGVLLSMTAGVVILFTGFLLFTYVAHFPASWAVLAHSFFRYWSQASLAVMLALAVALRPSVKIWLENRRGRYLAAPRRAAVALVLILPLLFAPRLRFDLDPPQPQLWDMATGTARHIAPGARIALLLPGDIGDTVAGMVRGVMMFTPPRRPMLQLRTEEKADRATLDAVAADGYSLALVSCTPAGLDGVPAGVAALMKHGEEGWRAVETWSYPPHFAKRRLSAMLARGPVCGDEPGTP